MSHLGGRKRRREQRESKRRELEVALKGYQLVQFWSYKASLRRTHWNEQRRTRTRDKGAETLDQAWVGGGAHQKVMLKVTGQGRLKKVERRILMIP